MKNNDDVRNQFPILKKEISYLDNAATTQKPESVINKISSFYKNINANTHRGIYKISVEATKELEDAREEIAQFINVQKEEIFFVKNATEGFNMLARALEQDIQKEDNIVTTILEHHSNFAPWLELSKRTNADFKIAKKEPFEESIIELVNENTKIVTITMMSNVSGLIIDVKHTIQKIRNKNKNCTIIIDAAQAIAHKKINVKELDCDFLIFSGHKIYGPLGVGVVYGKINALQQISPTTYGGGMITDYKEEFIYNEIPYRFEAGTIDVASIAGLREAINFFSKIENKFQQEQELKDFALKELRQIKGINIIGHDEKEHGPVISFTIKGIHPHDVASIADSFNVCIRAGHHCAKPYMSHLQLESTCRASIAFYNNKEDIIKLIDAIKKAKVIFNE